MADFKILGFSTYFQKVAEDEDIIRIVALTRDDCGLKISQMTTLMQERYPSIWIEIQDKRGSRSLIGGFYRQWSLDGKLSVPEEVICSFNI